MDAADVADLINRREELRVLGGQLLGEALRLYPYRDDDGPTIGLLNAMEASRAAMWAKSDDDMEEWIATMCEAVNDG